VSGIFAIIDRLLSTPFSKESLERDFSLHLAMEGRRWTDNQGSQLFSRVQLIDVPSGQRAMFDLRPPYVISQSEVAEKYDLDPGNIIQMSPEIDRINYRIRYPGQELFLSLTGGCLSAFVIARPSDHEKHSAFSH
jgi:hypothetical protein